MTDGLKDTIVAHPNGNPRAMAVMGDMLLAAAAEKDSQTLDEKLFIETIGETATAAKARR